MTPEPVSECRDLMITLNNEQQNAVRCTDGPVMVIAGPGSGKTRVLTYRVAWLLQKGVAPYNILALTFTNKAAREIRERIEKLIGTEEAKNIWAGTFHSIFARILRMEAEHAGFPPQFTIYDTADSKNLVKTIIREQHFDDKIYSPDSVFARISKMKNGLILPDAYMRSTELLQQDEIKRKPHFGVIYQSYVSRCRRSGCMDFDDLLVNTYLLFEKKSEILEKYSRKFRYIMVDEFQDTNPVQYRIIRQLSGVHRNICVVGDDAQSIYAFRGATIANIFSFRSDFPGFALFKLEENYRSTVTIVQTANRIIEKNKKQIPKTIRTKNEDGDKIKALYALTDSEEGMLVAQSIFEEKNNRHLPNSHFAVFYRTNAQSRALEESLRRFNIPYRIFGGVAFYQRKEIKDILAYFYLTVNPNNDEALRRIINYPPRGIGDTTVERLFSAAAENGCPVWDIASAPDAYALQISPATKKKITDFISMIRGYRDQLPGKNAYDMAHEITSGSGILAELFSDQAPEGISRYENAQELLNGIKDFSDNIPADRPFRTLDEFIQDIALLTDWDKDPDQTEKDYVSLMTLHSAKGLEFPYVYIAGVEEKLLPSWQSMGSPEEIEEERRLFYVGVTRAGKKVTLSFAQSRYQFGNLVYNEPSRFLQEMDEKYLEFPARYISDRMMKSGEPVIRYAKRITTGVTKTKAHPLPVTPMKKLTRIHTVPAFSAPDDFTAVPAQNVHEGMLVEHLQFGRGKVVATEGVDLNRKATVDFEKIGQKVLLLRFAKLKALN